MAKKNSSSAPVQEHNKRKVGRPKKNNPHPDEKGLMETPEKKKPGRKPKSATQKGTDVSFPSSLEEQIYGAKSDNIDALPFPVSDFQTQTKNIIKEYGIDISRLPKEILMAVNAMISDFTFFVQNPQNYGMIGAIMDKDLTALNMLKAWIEPRKELLLSIKKDEPEQIKVLPPATESVVQAAPSPSASGTVNNGVHQNTFIPRMPENTYQHNFSSPMPPHENKNVHYEILAQADAAIKAHNHAHQNWQGVHEQQAAIIDPQKIFEDYCKTINDLIKGNFQCIHWGYILESELRNIISTLNQSYKYEIVVAGEQSCVEVRDESNSFRTDYFSMK